MKRLLMATAMMGAMALSGTALAQSPFDLSQPPVGKDANTFMVRVRAIGVIPQDSESSISVIGGRVSTTAQPAPEVDVSYFFTDHLAAELIAASTRHSIVAQGTAAGNVDVGSAWVLPPTLTLQWHFLPKERFSPYVGAGVNVSFFYASQPAGGIVTKATLSNSWGPAIQAGVDYNIGGHWFANFDVKQIFLNTSARLNTLVGPIKAKDSLNPLVVGAGIGYRF